jgi:hypothetical protein
MGRDKFAPAAVRKRHESRSPDMAQFMEVKRQKKKASLTRFVQAQRVIVHEETV